MPQAGASPNVIELPFPSPDSFGSASRSIVVYNEYARRFEYFVALVVPSAGCSADCVKFSLVPKSAPDGYSDSDYIGGFSLQFVFQVTNSIVDGTIDPKASIFLYRYWWYTSQNSYSLSRLPLPSNSVSETSTVSYSFNGGNGERYPRVSISCYNGAYVNQSGSIYAWRNTNYSFLGDSGISSIINRLDNIDSSINSYSSSFDTLLEQNQTIVFYVQEILNELKANEDFNTEPETTNQIINDYEQAEGELLDNGFSNIDSAASALPDLNNFNSGNQSNAFKFISSNIEFFGGLSPSLGSLSKIGTVMMVVLGLGLASFIIGLTNRRKE